MRWVSALIAITLFCAAGARAQDSARSILVLDLKSVEEERERAKAFATVVTHALDDELEGATVYSGRDLSRLAELEGEKSSVGCDIEVNSCLTELADAMGARFVVYGTLGALGGSRFIELTVIDMEAARPVDRVLVRGREVDELANKLTGELPGLARALASAMGTRRTPKPPKIEGPTERSRPKNVARTNNNLQNLESELALHTAAAATSIACAVVGGMVGATLCTIGVALPTSFGEVRPIGPKTELIVGGLALGTVCVAVGGGVGAWQLAAASEKNKEITALRQKRAAMRF